MTGVRGWFVGSNGALGAGNLPESIDAFALKASWRVLSHKTVQGEALPGAGYVSVYETPNKGRFVRPSAGDWSLCGVTSYTRYVRGSEHKALSAVQAPLARPECTQAALIPLSKSNEWWGLSADERRDIMEAQSAHIATGLKYLPAIARRLYHSRDLGEDFDFLTWFEFTAGDKTAFDDLVGQLRESPEWAFVTRETDIRLSREIEE